MIGLPSLHVALESVHPVGAVSVSAWGFVVVLTGMMLLVPLPLDVKTGVTAPSRKKLNWAPASLGDAFFTIRRKPSLMISTQSEGSEFGLSEGKEHVLTMRAVVPPTSDI